MKKTHVTQILKPMFDFLRWFCMLNMKDIAKICTFNIFQVKNLVLNLVFCNCNYILFTQLPWPGDSEGTFRSSSQAATCPPVYHTQRRLHTVPLIAEYQAGKLWIPIFIVFGLKQLGIEFKSTASAAYALSTRPIIVFFSVENLIIP